MPEDQAARYDRIAASYARYWAPVIRPASIRLFDHLDPLVSAPARGSPLVSPRANGSPGTPGSRAVNSSPGMPGSRDANGSPDENRPLHVLDVGTGTGTLAFDALRRWPSSHVTGIDASSEMVAWARARATEGLTSDEARRLTTAVAFADDLPFEGATFDLAISSFVLQLVPDRVAALREIRRVLRPGAVFGYATWLRGTGEIDPPDRILDAVLDEFGFDPPEPDSRCGDAASVRSAADELRRAGFRHVSAREGLLAHRWTVRGYADFIEHFSEESLFDELAARERSALRRRLVERLRKLRPHEMRLRLPVVYVFGRARA